MGLYCWKYWIYIYIGIFVSCFSVYSFIHQYYCGLILYVNAVIVGEWYQIIGSIKQGCGIWLWSLLNYHIADRWEWTCVKIKISQLVCFSWEMLWVFSIIRHDLMSWCSYRNFCWCLAKWLFSLAKVGLFPFHLFFSPCSLQIYTSVMMTEKWLKNTESIKQEKRND